MSNTETIYYYEDERGPLVLPLPYDETEYENVRKNQGFEKENFFSPFCHTLQHISCPFGEILVYHHKEWNVKICELWDHAGLIIALAVHNPTQYLKLIKNYLEIIHNAIQIDWISHHIEKKTQ